MRCPRAGLHTPPAGGIISGGFGFAPVCILSHRLHGRMASGTDFPHGRQQPFPSCKSTAPNPIRSAPAAHSGRMALSRPGGDWLRQRSGPTFFGSARAVVCGHVHAEALHVEHGQPMPVRATAARSMPVVFAPMDAMTLPPAFRPACSIRGQAMRFGRPPGDGGRSRTHRGFSHGKPRHARNPADTPPMVVKGNRR